MRIQWMRTLCILMPTNAHIHAQHEAWKFFLLSVQETHCRRMTAGGHLHSISSIVRSIFAHFPSFGCQRVPADADGHDVFAVINGEKGMEMKRMAETLKSLFIIRSVTGLSPTTGIMSRSFLFCRLASSFFPVPWTYWFTCPDHKFHASCNQISRRMLACECARQKYTHTHTHTIGK